MMKSSRELQMGIDEEDVEEEDDDDEVEEEGEAGDKKRKRASKTKTAASKSSKKESADASKKAKKVKKDKNEAGDEADPKKRVKQTAYTISEKLAGLLGLDRDDTRYQVQLFFKCVFFSRSFSLTFCSFKCKYNPQLLLAFAGGCKDVGVHPWPWSPKSR
jgi:hypothetical protein